jgi:hypothetical protein
MMGVTIGVSGREAEKEMDWVGEREREREL